MLSEGQIAVPLRDVLKRHRNVECLLAEVVDVDVEGRTVIADRPTASGSGCPTTTSSSPPGCGSPTSATTSSRRWAPGMKTLSDALTIRQRVFGAFELAETATTPDEQRRWLTFAIVGGGPDRRGARRPDPGARHPDPALGVPAHPTRSDARVLLFDGGDAPLASFGPELSAKAATRSAIWVWSCTCTASSPVSTARD